LKRHSWRASHAPSIVRRCSISSVYRKGNLANIKRKKGVWCQAATSKHADLHSLAQPERLQAPSCGPTSLPNPRRPFLSVLPLFEIEGISNISCSRPFG